MDLNNNQPVQEYFDASVCGKQQWELVKRNRAITGRNRNIDALNEMLGTEFKPMELEKV